MFYHFITFSLLAKKAIVFGTVLKHFYFLILKSLQMLITLQS